MALRTLIFFLCLSTAALAQYGDVGDGETLTSDSSPEPPPKNVPLAPSPDKKTAPPPATGTNTVSVAQTPAQLILALGDKFPFRPNIFSDAGFWAQDKETLEKFNKQIGLVPLATTEHETVLQVGTRFDVMATPVFDATFHFTDGLLKRIRLNFVRKGSASGAHAEDVRKLIKSLEPFMESAGCKPQHTGNKLKCTVGHSIIELDSNKCEGFFTPAENNP